MARAAPPPKSAAPVRAARRANPLRQPPSRTSAATARASLPISRAIVISTLLVSIGDAVLIGQRIQASLGDPTNTLYAASTQQTLLTTFLRVAVAATACWLVALRPRAGYVLAAVFGAFTLIVFAIGYLQPIDVGPPLSPAWLQAAGVLAAAAMTVISGHALRRGDDRSS